MLQSIQEKRRNSYMKEIVTESGVIKYGDYGDGEVIVFLHGTLSNGNTWRKVIPTLSKQFRCIVPDLPLGGHTIPLKTTADLSPYGIAHIIHQFLQALQLQRVILLGNDTGGAYAQIFTMLYPSAVTKLILINTDAFEIFPPKSFDLLKSGVDIPGFTWLMAQLFKVKPALKSSMILGLLSYRVTKEELYELYVRHFISQSGVRADFTKVVKGWSNSYTHEAAEKLTHFHKPVLVLWGADDEKLFPLELGKRVASIFSNASFKAVDHSLTYVQEDQPELFTHELLHFLHYSN